MPDERSTGQLIGRIEVSPKEVETGESFLVEVFAPDGTSYANSNDVQVIVNGVTGGRQYLQIARAGDREIGVLVSDGSRFEKRTESVTVKESVPASAGEGASRARDTRSRSLERTATAPGAGTGGQSPPAFPLLHVGHVFDSDYHVSFSIGPTSSFPRGLSSRPQLSQRVGFIAGHPAGPHPNPVAGIIPDDGMSRLLEPSLGTLYSSRIRLRPEVILTGHTRYVPEDARLLKNGAKKTIGYTRIFEPVTPGSAPHADAVSFPSAEVPVYHWDFGDGHKEMSHSTRIDHDYSDALDPDKEHQQFDVKVKADYPNGATREVARTLTVFNAYAMCKKRGVIVPPVEGRTFAEATAQGYKGELRIRNCEGNPLTLVGMRIRPHANQEDDPAHVLDLEALASPIVIPANGSKLVTVIVAFSDVPKDSTGFTVYYFGNAPDGSPIRVEGSFDIRVDDQRTPAVVVGGTSTGLVLAPARLPSSISSVAARLGTLTPVRTTATTGGRPPTELHRNLSTILSRGGSAGRTRSGPDTINDYVLGHRSPLLSRQPESTAARSYYLSAAKQPAEGEECDPYNLPELTEEQIDEGWACQATEETAEVEVSARFLNALKGDIILSPGGNGVIGGLVRQVRPPQRYSHCGIMTRNYDQVTHSTASEDRLLDRANGEVDGKPAPREGFMPNALKYMWPGIVTQEVEKAIFGEKMTDPEDASKEYRVSSFTPTPETADINGHWEIIPPLVVKPDPLIETSEIRDKLRQVANDALSQTGNSHYRLFCYTDPTIGQGTGGLAPASAGWAAGTYPSVCSSFIWMAMKRQGVSLESANATVTPSDLETLDISAGAEVGEDTPDGLYLYTAAERKEAATWLHAELRRLISRKLEDEGIFGQFAEALDLWDMNDDAANQIVNTFISDWAATAAKDSDAWKEAKDAIAVGPDNILFWDSPAAVGLYGLAAPLSYRSRRLERLTIHRWRKVPTRGTLMGRVTMDGAPVQGCYVQVTDGKVDYTDASGNYEITRVPFGSYEVNAFIAAFKGVPGNATVPMEMAETQQILDIALNRPSDYYRRITISATIKTIDDETWPWKDEKKTTNFYKQVDVGPWHTHEVVDFEQRMGGEIRIELHFEVDVNMDRSVEVVANAKLYEGTTESTDDLDDEENASKMVIPKNMQQSGSIHLYNSGAGGGDSSDISFTVTNGVQP